MITNWTAADMAELGHRHARLEGERTLDALMDTLCADPVYEFHPAGLTFSGGDTTHRYYDQFIREFMSRIQGYDLVDEWVNERSVAQEYVIRIKREHSIIALRTVGVLFLDPSSIESGDPRLGGERIYGSEQLVREFTGEMYRELKPL
jgi:hypothetical protein